MCLSEIKTVYKIFQHDRDKGTLRNLHHGIGGSKTIPKGEWVKAVEKMVRDGGGGTLYLSGIHCFESIETLESYTKFSKPNLVICECEAKKTRPKEHSRVKVLLASELRILRIVKELEY